MGGCEKVSLISIAILAENVSAILQAILVSYSIGLYCCLYLLNTQLMQYRHITQYT